jgi:hypothetical protein
MLRCLTLRCVVAQHTDDGGAWYTSDLRRAFREAATNVRTVMAVLGNVVGFLYVVSPLLP